MLGLGVLGVSLQRLYTKNASSVTYYNVRLKSCVSVTMFDKNKKNKGWTAFCVVVAREGAKRGTLKSKICNAYSVKLASQYITV